MPVETRVQAIPTVLQALRDASPPAGRMLSVHLDTSPSRIFGQAYRIAFREQCKTIRAQLANADRGERTHFEAAVDQASRFLATGFVPAHPGLAIFASGDEDGFFAVPLPMPPPEQVTWSERPVTTPLESALDEFERIAVLLFDKERTRLFTVFLGEIEARHVLWDEVPGKQATGGWFALAQARYARHHEDHVLRHVKRTIGAVMDELHRHPFDRLLIGGPDEAIALLTQQLPRPLRIRLAGTLRLELFASEAEVLAAARTAAVAIEDQGEVVAVQELLEAASTPHVALGLGPTLAALTDRRVHRLFVADTLDASGGECLTCGRLTEHTSPCPTCGSATNPVADLAERAVDRAREQGAAIEIVSGQAAAKLMEHGGLGARTRY